MTHRSRVKLNDRARIFLSASVGEIHVVKACEELGISRQRFYELEDRALEAFLEAIEPKPAGRPPKEPDPTAPLQKQIEKLERENEKLWLYVKALRQMAGIEGEEKKR
jgi:hypothetical protein